MKLSERVERLEGPDRDWDTEIAHACGAEYGPKSGWCDNESGDYWTVENCALHYTASLDAAMTLVPEGFVLHNLQETPTIVHEEHTGWEPLPNWQATLLRQDCAGYRNRKKFMQAFEHGGGNTAALALCAAALKARGVRWAKYVPDLCRQDRQHVSNKGR